MRRLILMRHATAAPYAATDRARLLTPRGQSEATAAGAFLAAHDLVPDHALVSPAARTRLTWEAVARACGSAAEPVFDEQVYGGGPADVLEALRAMPDDAVIVLVVGHNPTVAALARLLDSGEGDPDATRRMDSGFPPAAMAVLEVPGGWQPPEGGTCRLAMFRSSLA